MESESGSESSVEPKSRETKSESHEVGAVQLGAVTRHRAFSALIVQSCSVHCGVVFPLRGRNRRSAHEPRSLPAPANAASALTLRVSPSVPRSPWHPAHRLRLPATVHGFAGLLSDPLSMAAISKDATTSCRYRFASPGFNKPSYGWVGIQPKRSGGHPAPANEKGLTSRWHS